MFPNTPIETLKGLSRADLIHHASFAGHCFPVTSCSPSTSPSDALTKTPRSTYSVEANERLFKLQCHDQAVSKRKEYSPGSRHVSESLSQDRTQFVGISSVAAAVRALRTALAVAHPDFSTLETFPPNTFPYSPTTFVPVIPTSYRDELRFIDTYFSVMHVFAPIIDESSFRYKYLTDQNHQDRPWLALLNMVLALGSIGDSGGESNGDIQYYNLAYQCLSLDSFESCHLEMLQALVLMGGQYLPLRNRPNMASAIIGACYRTAVGLGLHLGSGEAVQGKISVQEDIKRRICSTIYVLDTWGSLTLDRPFIPSDLLMQPPKIFPDDQVILNSDLHPYLMKSAHPCILELPSAEPTTHSLLAHNVELCKIVNKIQKRLSAAPVMADDELQSYDNLLGSWFGSLPPFWRCPGPGACDVHSTRLILQWRYLNIRHHLFRPILLDAVIRKSRTEILLSNEQAAIAKCRDIAAESIFSIQAEWLPNIVCCWSAVWFFISSMLRPLNGACSGISG